jgi:hypothetical protein
VCLACSAQPAPPVFRLNRNTWSPAEAPPGPAGSSMPHSIPGECINPGFSANEVVQPATGTRRLTRVLRHDDPRLEARLMIRSDHQSGFVGFRSAALHAKVQKHCRRSRRKGITFRIVGFADDFLPASENPRHGPGSGSAAGTNQHFVDGAAPGAVAVYGAPGGQGVNCEFPIQLTDERNV